MSERVCVCLVCVSESTWVCLVCVEKKERGGARSEQVGQSVGRRSAGAAPKVRTRPNDVGNKDLDLNILIQKRD